MTTTIGQTLRYKRSEKKKSLRSYAKELGITPSYLSDIENDLRVPSEEIILKIAETLDPKWLTFNYLMVAFGRLGSKTEAYLREHYRAVHLVRKIAELNLNDQQLASLMRWVEETP